MNFQLKQDRGGYLYLRFPPDTYQQSRPSYRQAESSQWYNCGTAEDGHAAHKPIE